MKQSFYFGLIVLFSLGLTAQNNTPVELEYPFAEPGTNVSRGVFGEDDRKEIKDAEGFQEFARATAVMVNKDNIYNDEFYSWSLREKIQNKYGKDIPIAADTKFLDQPAIGSCTGFLIAPDILVTAGHCINSMEDANKFVWVFDYTSESNFIENRRLNFKDEDIYEVESIITSILDDTDDYAVLKLTRKSERAPYRFRTSGAVLNGGAINTIGCPKGLPLKFSTNATVVDTSPKQWFKSDIDSFPGNSGGPVFDQNGFIEGILVRGAVTYDDDWSLTGDYYLDSSCNCIRTVTWESVKNTAGCQSQRITTVPSNALIMSIYSNLNYAIRNNLKDRFNSWKIYSWMFNHNYTNTNGRFENLALQVNNLDALNDILKVTSETLTDDQARNLINMTLSSGNANALKVLLDNDILADAGMNAAESALQSAIRSNKPNLAMLLINNGADTKVVDNSGNNLLHLAARTGNMDLARTLVNAGINAGAKNKSGQRPEKVAKKRGHKGLAKFLKRARKRR